MKRRLQRLIGMELLEANEGLITIPAALWCDLIFNPFLGDIAMRDLLEKNEFIKKNINTLASKKLARKYEVMFAYDEHISDNVYEFFDNISWERLSMTYQASLFKYRTALWNFFWQGAETYPFRYNFWREYGRQRTAYYNTLYIEEELGVYEDTSDYEALFLAFDLMWILRENIGVPRYLQGFFSKIIYRVYWYEAPRHTWGWYHPRRFKFVNFEEQEDEIFSTKRFVQIHANWSYEPFYCRTYYARSWHYMDVFFQHQIDCDMLFYMEDYYPKTKYHMHLDGLVEQMVTASNLYAIEEEHFLGYNMFEDDIYYDSAVSGQIGFQDPATPIMEGIIDLHHDLFFFMVVISIFVTWILSRIIYFFSIRNNEIHVPLRFTHHTTLEVVWTIIPSLILILIAVPSFALLYAMDEVINPSITIKTVGHQWYWSYEYSDQGVLAKDQILFDSYMMLEEDLTLGYLRLLEVDNRVVLPSKVHVRLLITAADVLHSWAVPSLGVKLDACPGRLNQVAVYIKRNGTFYGQCSEICGVNHAFMPITVDAVSMDDYIQWVSSKLDENN
jgi:cytochrome c oxidase subunit 2